MDPKRKRLPAADRRTLLISAAARLFARDGYDATNLEQIAREAGVTKPVLYRHFASKKDLYLTLLRRHSDDLPTFLADLPATDDPRELLEGILDRWLRYAAANPHGWQLIFRDGGGDEEVRAYRRAVNRRARELISGFLEHSPQFELPTEELEPTAELISAGLAAMVLWWQEHPEVSRRALVGGAARLISGLAR